MTTLGMKRHLTKKLKALEATATSLRNCYGDTEATAKAERELETFRAERARILAELAAEENTATSTA